MRFYAGSKPTGFTLVELMIVIAVVAILTALAIPSYQQWVLKANRGDAQSLLLNWANNQEIFRASNATYAGVGNLPAPTDPKGNFTFAVSDVTATTYTLTATAAGRQANDKEQSVTCSPMTLNQNGAKTPPVCWRE